MSEKNTNQPQDTEMGGQIESESTEDEGVWAGVESDEDMDGEDQFNANADVDFEDSFESENENDDKTKNNAGLNPFYSTPDGFPTVATQADFAKTLSEAEGAERDDLVELDRYWAVYPYSFVSICRSKSNGERRYFVVEPFLSEEEKNLLSHLSSKVEDKIRNIDTQVLTSDDQHRRAIIREAAIDLLDDYNMLSGRTVFEAHDRSEIATDNYESDTRSKIEKIIQRVLIGTDSEFDSTPISCRENAFGYGVSGESDYLPVINRLEGHPMVDENIGGAGTFEGENENEKDNDKQSGDDRSLLESITNTLGRDSDGVDKSETGITDLGEENVEWDLENDGEEDDESVVADGGAVVTESTTTDTSQEHTPTNMIENLSLPASSASVLADDAALSEEENANPLTEYQLYKLLYYLEREFVGYKKIDAIKNDDKNVEDIRVPGYNAPVFVHHKNFGRMQSNIIHGEDDLDDFITTLAQFAGEELSRRQPRTEAKLPDGSRAELEKGYEISDTGSSYTIRQFKDVPHTPIDLVNWNTYDIDQMAILWLFIQNDRSLLISGGTGAGKTTTLNALSLFVPSQSWIVSIEDTQEIDLPHKNWTANTTREAGDLTDEGVEVDEFDLLRSALRKRPDNIIVGEVRGREAFELLQSIRTGHPGMTTFHAPSFDDMIDRMTSEPINVPLQLMTAIDAVLVQGETRVDGEQVRRSRNIVEITGYDTDNDGVGILESKDISKWDAMGDEQQLVAGNSHQFAQIAEENGWDAERQRAELLERQVVIAGLVSEGINEYTEVSAVLQAAMLNRDKVLRHIANGTLRHSVDDFAENISNISINMGEGEHNVERPEPDRGTKARANKIIEDARNGGVLSEYV